MKTAIIIPCYNEAQRLKSTEIISFISVHYKDIHIYLVNDGSNDETINILYKIKNNVPEGVKVVDLKTNAGKAEAVRQGIVTAQKENQYDSLLFLDADFSTSLNECLRFIHYAETHTNIKLICGSRIKKMGATIKRSTKRHYIGRLFASVSYFILPLPIYDTQCGAKLIRSEVIELIFSKPFATKWLFDIEILLRLSSHLGYTKTLEQVYEIPLLKWVEVGKSKIGILSLIKIPFEILKIYRNYSSAIKALKKQ